MEGGLKILKSSYRGDMCTIFSMEELPTERGVTFSGSATDILPSLSVTFQDVIRICLKEV